jgi:hypothetical protein
MKRWAWTFGLVLAFGIVSAQQGTMSPARRMYFGVGGGFGAGTNTSGFRYNYYSVFPVIGYRVTDQFSAGAGLNYLHYGYPDFGPAYSYSQYGFMPFIRYNFNQLFFQMEYDMISSPTIDNTTGLPETTKKLFSRLLFGLGYYAPMGKQTAINVMAMYDVLYHNPSPFNSPVVLRVFVTF